MKKVVLIEPQSQEDHVYKNVQMPRLGLPLMGAALKAAGYRVELYYGTGASLPWPAIVSADFVGISTTTATSSEAYRMAGYLRSRGLPVIIGGIHAHFLPDEALGHADYVVRGEADLIIVPLIRALEEGRLPRDLPGVSFWDGREAVHNPCSAEPVEMDQLPLPDFSLFQGKKHFRTIPVMTSRGCPEQGALSGDDRPPNRAQGMGRPDAGGGFPGSGDAGIDAALRGEYGFCGTGIDQPGDPGSVEQAAEPCRCQ
jgi:radical SAM superfamily enzyme YgiQ (UPF0313 family)